MKKKMMSVTACMLVLMISLAATLTVRSGVISGLSSEVDSQKAIAEEAEKNKQTFPGTIFDVNGHRLAYNRSINGPRYYIDPYVYSSLLSFHSGGLEYIYQDDIFTHGDKKYKSHSGKTYYKGSNLHLTINHKLSKKAYALISKEPDASIVVLKGNGAIECMVSSKTFNVNTVTTNYADFQPGDLMNPAKDYLSPCGSVLKPVVGELLTDYRLSDEFMVNDTGAITLDTGEIIHNADGTSYGKLTLRKAMVVSSNVFFISAAEQMGPDLIESRYQELRIGEKISTDFGTISSTSVEPDNTYNLAMNTLGQNVGLSTVHLAIILKAVTTGEVVRPFLIKELTKDENSIAYGKKDVLARTSASPDTRKAMNSILKDCANSYGLTPEHTGKQILAKTGTAEVKTASGKKNVATMLLAFPADNPEHFVVIQSRNTELRGRNLEDIAISLIK